MFFAESLCYHHVQNIYRRFQELREELQSKKLIAQFASGFVASWFTCCSGSGKLDCSISVCLLSDRTCEVNASKLDFVEGKGPSRTGERRCLTEYIMNTTFYPEIELPIILLRVGISSII